MLAKISLLNKAEVLKRLKEADKKIESLYYYFSDQDFDIWMRYCNASTELEELIKLVGE